MREQGGESGGGKGVTHGCVWGLGFGGQYSAPGAKGKYSVPGSPVEYFQVEVVPGVSSIVAAPNYAGIPLTHRDHCSSFTVFTGHENSDDAKTNLSYEQIAKIPGKR